MLKELFPLNEYFNGLFIYKISVRTKFVIFDTRVKVWQILSIYYKPNHMWIRKTNGRRIQENPIFCIWMLNQLQPWFRGTISLLHPECQETCVSIQYSITLLMSDGLSAQVNHSILSDSSINPFETKPILITEDKQ